MRFGRMVLAASIIAWLGLGSWLYVNPLELSGAGLVADTANGRTEVRAFYGGLEVGIAAFLIWCLVRPERTRTGLVAALLTIGCTGLGRLSGMMMEGFQTTPIMWALVTVELLAALLTLSALRQLNRDR